MKPAVGDVWNHCGLLLAWTGNGWITHAAQSHQDVEMLRTAAGDWATKAAREICDAFPVSHYYESPDEEQVASIVSSHAAPLVVLLREARRSHDRGYNEESCDYPPCPKSDDGVVCTCGADAWNARVDAALGDAGAEADRPGPSVAGDRKPDRG